MILAAVVVEASLHSGRLHKKKCFGVLFEDEIKTNQRGTLCLLFVQKGGMLDIYLKCFFDYISILIDLCSI
jgi:hypothetical protein